jgi:hypothetical protein
MYRNACGQCVTAGYSHCREDDPTTIPPASDTKSFFPLEYSELNFHLDNNKGRQEEAEDEYPDWRWWEHYLSKRGSVDPVLNFPRTACYRHSSHLVPITQFSLGV